MDIPEMSKRHTSYSDSTILYLKETLSVKRMGQALRFSAPDISRNISHPQQQKEYTFRIQNCIMS